MTLLWHLAKKDLRAARVPLLIWIAVSVFGVIWQLASAPITPETRGVTQIEAFLRLVLPLTGIGAVLLIVSSVVHADPLVDANAFWLTRPIPPRTLFLAKLLTIALLVFGPPVIAETLLLIWFQVPAPTLTRLGFEAAFALTVPVILLFVVASITPDLRRYMLLIAVLFGVSLVASFVLAYGRSFGMTEVVVAEPRYADPTRPLVVTTLLTGALALIVRRHYIRRDSPVAAASSILVVAGTLVLVELWPPELSLFGAERAPDAAWAQPDVTRLRRDGDRVRVTPSGRSPAHAVAAPIVLDGLPADYTAAPFTLRGEMTYADGTVARSDRTTFLQMGATGTFRPSLTLAYGPMALASGPTAWEAWPILLQIPRTVLDGRLNEAGRYAGTFRYRLARHESLTTLPIQAGASYADDARRLVIREVGASVSQCRVALELAAPEFVLRLPREPSLGFHFVDRRTGARLRAVHEWTSPVRGTSLGGALSGVARAFTVRQVRVAVEDMATREHPYQPVPLACGDTRLVVVRTTPAGALTRTIEIPNLRLGLTSAERATRSRSR